MALHSGWIEYISVSQFCGGLNIMPCLKLGRLECCTRLSPVEKGNGNGLVMMSRRVRVSLTLSEVT
jgi:hypothetical protein